MEPLFFDDLNGIGNVLTKGILAYALLVTFLRLFGNRTLAQMNAFDFIITIALGSTLASILLSGDVALAEGAVALLLLVALQFLVTWTTVRHPRLRALVTGEPRRLTKRGRMLDDALRTARITEAEVRMALRDAGLASVADAEAVVLETNGTFTVVKASDGPAETLQDVTARTRRVDPRPAHPSEETRDT